MKLKTKWLKGSNQVLSFLLAVIFLYPPHQRYFCPDCCYIKAPEINEQHSDCCVGNECKESCSCDIGNSRNTSNSNPVSPVPKTVLEKSFFSIALLFLFGIQPEDSLYKPDIQFTRFDSKNSVACHITSTILRI